MTLDHRCFLLEDVNAFPIPKRFLDGEIPVVGALEPDLANSSTSPRAARPSTSTPLPPPSTTAAPADG